MCFPSFSPFCHDPVEILYVSGVVIVFCCFKNFFQRLIELLPLAFCHSNSCPDLKSQNVGTSRRIESCSFLKQLLFLSLIHTSLPAACKIFLRTLSHSRSNTMSNLLLSLISSGMIRYFLPTRAKLAAAWPTLALVQPIFPD